jgi:hypothetical protein
MVLCVAESPKAIAAGEPGVTAAIVGRRGKGGTL